MGDGCNGESLFGPFDAATFRAFGASCCLEVPKLSHTP